MKIRILIILVCVLWVSGLEIVEGAEPKFKITEARVKSLPPELQRDIAALLYMLNAYQLKQFFATPSDSLRREWLDTYWRALDPTFVQEYPRVELELFEYCLKTRYHVKNFSTQEALASLK